MTKEELSTYQAQWLRLRGIYREVKMMRLGGSRDPLYNEDMRKVQESLEVALEQLRIRIEGEDK
tara:strand:+ start:1547 stop:1738 length:192 start_codon:yes stop_codon:yes gene_type:complete